MPRRLPAFMAAAVVALMLVTTAWGHGFHRAPTRMWTEAGKCLNQTLTTGHGLKDSGFFRAEARARTRRGPRSGCSNPWYRHRGRLAIRLLVLKQLSDGSPAICFDTGRRSNKRHADEWHVSVMGPTSGKALCGRGRYKALGRASVRWRGRWRGGSMATTRWHSLPAGPSGSGTLAHAGLTLHLRAPGPVMTGLRRQLPLIDCDGAVVAHRSDRRPAHEGHVPCRQAAAAVHSG